jgi:2-oxoacid:acceptor oxidoreductase gamma subunit (pyruvate/2-ketoisovalerate family)
MLFVGRGGQGVVLASQILADALARAGYWVQSFPEFEAERRGAPIAAFLRWDGTPIHRRYKVRECDVLVALTASSPSTEVLARVRTGGLVLLNREERFEHTGPFAIARVPASRIARSYGIVSSGAADGQHCPSRRLRPAAAPRRIRVPRAVDRDPHGQTRRSQHQR